MANKKVKYVEPVSYFSKETRKMFGLGEYAEKKNEAKPDAKKTTKETKKTK